ncbi:hypothetical protein [uncultured Rubinisphaera sp.]|uniref:hypothetical protein n=1 Tax=uncultured Rubinisphaera sp. TaxID=1678686 RepID=UPI0030DAB9B2
MEYLKSENQILGARIPGSDSHNRRRTSEAAVLQYEEIAYGTGPPAADSSGA